jgi:hypothetical protein
MYYHIYRNLLLKLEDRPVGHLNFYAGPGMDWIICLDDGEPLKWTPHKYAGNPERTIKTVSNWTKKQIGFYPEINGLRLAVNDVYHRYSKLPLAFSKLSRVAEKLWMVLRAIPPHEQQRNTIWLLDIYRWVNGHKIEENYFESLYENHLLMLNYELATFHAADNYKEKLFLALAKTYPPLLKKVDEYLAQLPKP